MPNKLFNVVFTIILVVFVSCKENKREKSDELESTEKTMARYEAITLSGDTLFTPEIKPGDALKNFEKAKKTFEESPTNADALVWYGRRTAYLGQFQDAIERYSEGIEKFPEDARFYRHRGHRYISTRQYDKAIADFKKALELVEGQPDQVEPDGMPNERNIPIGTLKSNIWYHLGLAYYLNGDFEKAREAYEAREVTQKYDDNLVSGAYWSYMILRRLGQEDAAAKKLEKITPDMDVIENTSYYKMCLFYKNLISQEELGIQGDGSPSDDVFYYGLGNWNLFQTKDTVQAKSLFKKLLDNGNPYSFAYLAAEADWNRLFDQNNP